MLSANLSLNGIQPVELHRQAVTADRQEHVTLWMAKKPWLHTLISPEMALRFGAKERGVTSNRYTGQGTVVESIDVVEALESILTKEGKIDILKIDIEGTELDLLSRMPADLLASCRYITAECGWGEQVDSVAARLNEMGFISHINPPYLYVLNARLPSIRGS